MINKLQRPGFPSGSANSVDKATSDLVVEMMNAGTKLHITHLLVTGVGSPKISSSNMSNSLLHALTN
jgi:hypothetical protein